ncbi:MAG: hypothetical protein AAF245_13265 [Pseudomonadota bacterium]
MILPRIELDYRLAPGWMEGYVTGLNAGRAMGRQCNGCARVSFPPLRVCPCGEADGSWVPLPGRAEVQYRTEGADGRFAMVQFEGAATRTVVRLSESFADGTQGALRPQPGPMPPLILYPLQVSSA